MQESKRDNYRMREGLGLLVENEYVEFKVVLR